MQNIRHLSQKHAQTLRLGEGCERQRDEDDRENSIVCLCLELLTLGKEFTASIGPCYLNV